MKKYFFVLVVSFLILLVVNITWIISTIVNLIVNGIQYFVHGGNFVQSVVTSVYLKWIMLLDLGWIISFLVYFFVRKEYRAKNDKHFLESVQLIDPNICVVIPAYNEEDTIKQVVTDHYNQKFVTEVLVIDNHSEDKTVELAKQSGARVITKMENKGYQHSLVVGLKEALKTNANVIVITEADGTLSATDLSKMLPYLVHCDVVKGSRQIQVLNEKGNLREGIIHVWGNYFLSKLIQLKYVNFLHLGIANLNDVSCMLRMFRREVIEKISNQMTYPGTDVPIGGNAFPLFLDMKCLDEDMKIIEIPVTFKKRLGESRLGSEKKLKSLKYGWLFLKVILTY